MILVRFLLRQKSFVNNYNKMSDAAESSSNSGVVANLSLHQRKKQHAMRRLWKQFGISVDQKAA